MIWQLLNRPGCGRTLGNTCLFAGRRVLVRHATVSKAHIGPDSRRQPRQCAVRVHQLTGWRTDGRQGRDVLPKEKKITKNKRDRWSVTFFRVVIVTRSVSIFLFFFWGIICKCQRKSQKVVAFFFCCCLKNIILRDLVSVKVTGIKFVCFSQLFLATTAV